MKPLCFVNSSGSRASQRGNFRSSHNIHSPKYVCQSVPFFCVFRATNNEQVLDRASLFAPCLCHRAHHLEWRQLVRTDTQRPHRRKRSRICFQYPQDWLAVTLHKPQRLQACHRPQQRLPDLWVRVFQRATPLHPQLPYRCCRKRSERSKGRLNELACHR